MSEQPSSESNNGICDACTDFHKLLKNLENYLQPVTDATGHELLVIDKDQLNVFYHYLGVWVQRQCLCIYKDQKVCERFSLAIQGVVTLCVRVLKNVKTSLKTSANATADDKKDLWSHEDLERLLQYVAKVFMLQFPLYAGPKQAGLRNEEVSAAEATQMAVYCDVHDSTDFPVALLRNVSYFCKSGGLQGMANAFLLPPEDLPPSLAHALISILCNVKLWLNYRAVTQLFTPVRTNALKYMCELSDMELRQQHARHIADFLWSSVKENVDGSPPISFDKDGLELAFKYFCSTTLTMRLAGITQINSHISLFNEMCNAESVVEVENVGLQLAGWILGQKIVEHIFGPNLHVEVIKQCHVLLNFLAVEGKISNEHINVIWQAAQLKHCSKQVHDLLLPLIKNLEAGPVLHLYDLMKELPVKEHTEQTIHLAQVLQKFIWTSGGTFSHLLHEASALQNAEKMAALAASGAAAAAAGSAFGLAGLSSSDMEDADSSPASAAAPALNPLAATAAVLMASQQQKANKANKDLLEKSVINSAAVAAANCGDFVNDFSDDDDDEEDDDDDDDDEEDDDDDDEDDDDEDEEDTEKEEEKFTTAVPAAKKDVEPVKEASGKRTKGLPMKGAKRARTTNDESSESEQEKECCKKVKKPECGKSDEQPFDPRLWWAAATAATANNEASGGEGSSSVGSGPLMSPAGLWKTPVSGSSGGGGQSTAMAELANLVNAHPRAGMQAEVHDMRPFLRNLAATQKRWVEDCISDDNDSMSSRLSNKSDKNLGDFDDENSVEEEMLQLAQSIQHHQQLANMASFCQQQRITAPRLTARQQREGARLLAHYKLDSACQPGNTLLWDLLQDRNIEQLSEGLAAEAEKALSNLLCLNMDRLIRIKFVEGCLQNIGKNESVAISLRLMPKLFQSFHNFRGMDTHEVSMFAERRHNMMKLFFDNLTTYTENHKVAGKVPAPPFFNHLAQIQVRLSFLSVIFSIQVSPNDFHLNKEQINILWSCLAKDPVCSDDFFQWLLLQVHTKDQHAITMDGFRLIYTEKLPELRPESISMLGLNLFSQLWQLARLKKPTGEENSVKMDQLWKIALCAQNTDVSMKAIQILNSAYFGQGEDFLITCMQNLQISLDLGSEEILTKIQRALLLLKTYLETFRRKYAYHFRRMSIDGQGVHTHAELVDLKSQGPIRIMVQAAGAPGLQEKVTFDMQLTDLVADLRAEITAWWESKASNFAIIKESKLGDSGPLRLISQGQEISADTDEKNLSELGFKDMQLVFVSQGARSGAFLKNSSAEIPPFPGKEKMPMNLLLKPVHFEQLFKLMQTLSDLRVNGNPHPKAQILSRRVWDILMLLPTNPTLKEKLQTITAEDKVTLKDLLDPRSPQKLMYIFYIIDWLGRPARLRRPSGLSDNSSGSGPFFLPTDPELGSWTTRFVKAGGLKLLFNIFASGDLQSRDGTVWCEWRQDCLSALLKLLLQFGVNPEDYDALAEQILEGIVTPRKRQRGSRGGNASGRKSSGYASSSRSSIIVPRLSKAMTDLMDVDTVIAKTTSVLLEASQFAKDPNAYRTGVFGRSQVIHYAMNFLVSWVFSNEGNEDAMFSSNGLLKWLRSLLLDDHDPTVRREVCTGLYRLCLGSTGSGTRTGSSCTAPLLSVLLEFLDDALVMEPLRRDNPIGSEQDGKEPYGPACRDYFWILCRLVENIHDPDTNELVDLDHLARQLACGVVSRKLYEKRHGDNTPDDTLVGALQLLCCVMKQQPPFKNSPEGQEFLLHLLECLFALPSPREKNLPKCKSPPARTACYDLLVEMSKGSLSNYLLLHKKLMKQHSSASHKPYPWEHWPKDDGRSECGYVGLTNLGATCYMATCVQQLYMIPAARDGILTSSVGDGGKHPMTLQELQRMFAYLRDSERKAYNPLSFCKTYEMDHQPLNTGEQKDMAEFFIDLLSKTEEMSPELKVAMKKLFCGTLTNNVVSLDCNHVSRTAEEFYTVRCQVSEMRNLFQSLEEVTVKDTLEGDNMYTCSQCNKKVRAEKRACFKKLPKVLAFNTMRYTFNMVTMLKEKVNTHFSFPFRLDMQPYMEHNLIPKDKEEMSDSTSKKDEVSQDDENPSYEYELIGVTVHTGTADGGHYYAFIRDRYGLNKDKWYSFNDAEVKPFDPNQIAAECFGGEMNSRTYDQVTDKFMDLSIEKTNSAYMLFYERIEKQDPSEMEASASIQAGPSEVKSMPMSEVKSPMKQTLQAPPQFGLSQALEEWIWEDNMNFIQDNNIFDHTYFNFMWQMVSYVPNTLNPESSEDITLLAVKLATSFFLESFIHAKEKLNIVQWVELLTKQFDSSTAACSWFLSHMASDNTWPVTIFLKCHVNTIRQMFHRLCIHVIQKLRDMEKSKYLLPWIPTKPYDLPCEKVRPNIGMASPITRFLRTVMSLLESGVAKPYLKHLTELFRFLHDFAKLGDGEEATFMLSTNTITTFVEFYLKAIRQTPEGGHVDVVSDDDDEDDDDIVALTPIGESNKLASLEKMVWLLVVLVEKSRGEDNQIHLSNSDIISLTGKSIPSTVPSAAATSATASAASSSTSIAQPTPQAPSSSSRGLVFLYNITKDNINICQTGDLIFALARNNQEFAESVAAMVFQGVKQTEYYMNFFRLLTLLTELPGAGGPPGMPCFTSLVMHKVWELAKTCPQPALDWLSIQVARNRYVQSWLVSTMDNWVEQYLLAHPNQKVRSSAAFLVVSLVNSSPFRQAFRTTRMQGISRENLLGNNREDLDCLHQILNFLYGLLPNAKHYTDLHTHGTAKLVAYFQTMTHFLLGPTEKLMFEPHFVNLWQLFHPKLSEPAIPVHHNKQALLHFWYTLCLDCAENVRLILSNPMVTKNIAFNYILADHEDTEVVNFNRMMLPTYYGLLKLCCVESRHFRRQLAQHQNIQWAFKNITPYYTQYTMACEELFELMTLFIKPFKKADGEIDKQEKEEIRSFRHQTLQLYLTTLDGRTSWSTLIQVLEILVQTDEDRLFVVFNNGLSLIYEAFNMLQMMFHEATACHVTAELIDLLTIFAELIKAVKLQNRSSSSKSTEEALPTSEASDSTSPSTSTKTASSSDWRHILARWKDMGEMTTRLLTLCNSFVPSELREVCIACVKEMLMLWPTEMLTILVPLLHRSHNSSSDNSDNLALGPFFPRKNLQPMGNLKTVRPPRPIFQMSVPSSHLECHNGQDAEYDRALTRYFYSYHGLVDLMVRVAVNEEALSKPLVDLSAMVGLDGVPLHFQFFPKLWTDIYSTKAIDRKFIMMLVTSHGFLEYVDAVLLDERSSLNNSHVFNFLLNFFPKVCDQVLTDQVQGIIAHLVGNFIDSAGTFNLSAVTGLRGLNGDLRALILVGSTRGELLTEPLMEALKTLKSRISVLLETAQPSKEDQEESKKPDDNETDASSRKRRCSEDPPNTPPVKVPAMTKKQTEDQTKWKESLVMFLNTLNLLIGMCESSLSLPTTKDKNDENDDDDNNKKDNKEEQQVSETPPSPPQETKEESKSESNDNK